MKGTPEAEILVKQGVEALMKEEEGEQDGAKMPELIDRTSSMEQLLAIEQNDKLTDAQKFRQAKFVIENAPAVKQGVRHGRWIEQENPFGHHYNCSECGHEVSVPCSEMIDPRDYVCYLDDYCGKCGARMDKRTPTEVELDIVDSVMMGDANDGS